MKLKHYQSLVCCLATSFFVLACTQEPPTVATPTALATPAAIGSMAPNLSMSPGGEMLLSWIEPDDDGNALRFSRFENAGWGAARTVASGDNWFVNWADFPSVVALSESLLAAHWLVSQEAGGYAYDIHAAFSTDSGVSWSEPFIPHSDGTATEHGFVSLFDDADGLGMVWLDGRKMINDYDDNNVRASGMTLRAGTFDPNGSPLRESLLDDLVCDCCQTDIAMTDDGPIAIYRNRTTDERRDIYVSRRESGTWRRGIAINDDQWDIAACPVNGPTLRAAGKTVAAAWFTAANDEPTVKVAWSNDAGRTFSDPILVDNNRPLGHVGSALLANGDLAVTWIRSDGAGGGNLFLSRITETGQKSADFPVPSADDVFAFSVPQLALHDSSLLLAWTSEKDGIYSVKSANIPVSMLD